METAERIKLLQEQVKKLSVLSLLPDQMKRPGA